MSQRQERAPSVAAESARAGDARTVGNSSPCGSIVPQPGPQGKRNILPLLSVGQQNARTAAELAQLLGCSRREVGAIVHALRVGARHIGEYPLATTEQPGGYYLPASSEEVQRFSRSMHSRRREIGQAVRLADAYLREGESDESL